MGIRLLWTGLTVYIGLHGRVENIEVLAALLMVVGCVMLWMDGVD